MSKKTVTQAVTRVVEELADFSMEERQRIVHASLTLLGDLAVKPQQSPDEIQSDSALPAKARLWMKQYGLSPEQIDQVFHRTEESVEVIAQVPGATKREQVRNAYVLCGIGQLVASGETRFDDQAARRLCEEGGFFDGTNHMKYMRASEYTGSKEKGWVLTSPGLKHAATLVNEITKSV